MVKLSIHIYYVSKINQFGIPSIYIWKIHLLCDVCIVYMDDYSKTSNVFFFIIHFFKGKSHVSVPFSWAIFGQN